MKVGEFKVDIERLEGYDFRVHFKDELDDLLMSEPTPLGSGEYPHGGHTLAAAVGHCMCSALIYCMGKARVGMGPLRAELYTKVDRNEDGRMRLTKIRVKLYPQVEDVEKANRCFEIFEDYCIVTQSVMEGIEVETEVIPSDV
jgi:uncharacterized OsmC-like protein